jgi:hypothetical protein
MGGQDKWLTITATTYNLPPGFSPGDDLSRYHLQVQYVAGYGSSYASVPMGIQEAIMKMVGAAYEMREDVQAVSRTGISGFIEIPNDAKSLLNAYRVIPL